MRITIVGAGFAGVKAALELARDTTNQITVITDKPDFQYYPSLYSSATGRSHLESWVPLGEIFGRYDNIRVVLDRVIGIDAKKRELIGASEQTYQYHTLIIAIGSVTTYFGVPGLDQYTYGIKSAEEIHRLKQRIYEDLAGSKQLDKNYVIVGGGPTGVELAGALGQYIRRLARYYGVRQRTVRVRLIEAAPRILPRSHPRTSQRVHRRLVTLGVEIATGTAVQKATAKQLIAGGRAIESHTVIWTSGVANNPLFAAHPDIFQLDSRGRVVVDQFMQAARNIYVLGDNAATPYSGLAQTALHDAKFVAGNLRRHSKGKPRRRYRAVRPASSIPVGTRWAAFEWHWVRMYGMKAAVLRRAADFIGYSDVLPLGQALRPWYASRVYQHDYFAPAARPKSSKRRRKS